MNSYAPRISLSYDEVKLVIPVWEAKANQIIVFQHDADSKVSRTHVHILIVGCTVKEERLKRMFYSVYPAHKEAGSKGNDLWKWASKYGTPDLGFITYMSKGKLRSKYSKNISPEVEESHRLKWSEPTTDLPPSKKKEYDEYTEIKKSYQNTHDLTNKDTIITLDGIRKWTMSWYYRRDGRLPPATAYKRNAGSLFIWANETRAGFIPDWCWEEVKNLWY